MSARTAVIVRGRPLSHLHSRPRMRSPGATGLRLRLLFWSVRRVPMRDPNPYGNADYDTIAAALDHHTCPLI